MFTPFGFMGSQAGGGGDADADAYIAAVITAGGTLSGTEEGAIQTLFTDLKTAGVYDEMFAFYPVIGGLEATHALNGLRVSSSFDLSFNGGWTHAASGMKPNGSTGYADTSVVYGASQINNNTFSIYTTETGSGSYPMDGGVYNSNGTDVWYLATYWGATGAARATNDWNDSVGWTATDGGLMINVRDAVANAEIWNNGSQVATITNSVGGGDSGGRSFWLGGANNGSLSFPANREQIFSFFHRRALTSTEIGDISTAINDYQTTLGRNTY